MRISDWSSDVCSSDLETDVTFTVPAGDLARSLDILESQKGEIGFYRIISDTKVAKISVVGVGMKSHAGIAAGMFKSLADRGINILAIRSEEHTSELQSLMRISYAVFCLKKKKKYKDPIHNNNNI